MLSNWLASLGIYVKDSDLSEEFANGYLLGKVLYWYNLIPDFEKKFKNDSSQRSLIENYNNIQAVLGQFPGLKFDARYASELIKKTPHKAELLLYTLKGILHTNDTAPPSLSAMGGKPVLVAKMPHHKVFGKPEEGGGLPLKHLDRTTFDRLIRASAGSTPLDRTQNTLQSGPPPVSSYRTYAELSSYIDQNSRNTVVINTLTQPESVLLETRAKSRQETQEKLRSRRTTRESIASAGAKEWENNMRVRLAEELHSEAVAGEIAAKTLEKDRKTREALSEHVTKDIDSFELTLALNDAITTLSGDGPTGAVIPGLSLPVKQSELEAKTSRFERSLSRIAPSVQPLLPMTSEARTDPVVAPTSDIPRSLRSRRRRNVSALAESSVISQLETQHDAWLSLSILREPAEEEKLSRMILESFEREEAIVVARRNAAAKAAAKAAAADAAERQYLEVHFLRTVREESHEPLVLSSLLALSTAAERDLRERERDTEAFISSCVEQMLSRAADICVARDEIFATSSNSLTKPSTSLGSDEAVGPAADDAFGAPFALPLGLFYGVKRGQWGTPLLVEDIIDPADDRDYVISDETATATVSATASPTAAGYLSGSSSAVTPLPVNRTITVESESIFSQQLQELLAQFIPTSSIHVDETESGIDVNQRLVNDCRRDTEMEEFTSKLLRRGSSSSTATDDENSSHGEVLDYDNVHPHIHVHDQLPSHLSHQDQALNDGFDDEIDGNDEEGNRSFDFVNSDVKHADTTDATVAPMHSDHAPSTETDTVALVSHRSLFKQRMPFDSGGGKNDNGDRLLIRMPHAGESLEGLEDDGARYVQSRVSRNGDSFDGYNTPGGRSRTQNPNGTSLTELILRLDAESIQTFSGAFDKANALRAAANLRACTGPALNFSLDPSAPTGGLALFTSADFAFSALTGTLLATVAPRHSLHNLAPELYRTSSVAGSSNALQKTNSTSSNQSQCDINTPFLATDALSFIDCLTTRLRTLVPGLAAFLGSYGSSEQATSDFLASVGEVSETSVKDSLLLPDVDDDSLSVQSDADAPPATTATSDGEYDDFNVATENIDITEDVSPATFATFCENQAASSQSVTPGALPGTTPGMNHNGSMSALTKVSSQASMASSLAASSVDPPVVSFLRTSGPQVALGLLPPRNALQRTRFLRRALQREIEAARARVESKRASQLAPFVPLTVCLSLVPCRAALAGPPHSGVAFAGFFACQEARLTPFHARALAEASLLQSGLLPSGAEKFRVFGLPEGFEQQGWVSAALPVASRLLEWAEKAKKSPESSHSWISYHSNSDSPDSANSNWNEKEGETGSCKEDSAEPKEKEHPAAFISRLNWFTCPVHLLAEVLARVLAHFVQVNGDRILANEARSSHAEALSAFFQSGSGTTTVESSRVNTVLNATVGISSSTVSSNSANSNNLSGLSSDLLDGSDRLGFCLLEFPQSSLELEALEQAVARVVLNDGSKMTDIPGYPSIAKTAFASTASPTSFTRPSHLHSDVEVMSLPTSTSQIEAFLKLAAPVEVPLLNLQLMLEAPAAPLLRRALGWRTQDPRRVFLPEDTLPSPLFHRDLAPPPLPVAATAADARAKLLAAPASLVGHDVGLLPRARVRPSVFVSNAVHSFATAVAEMSFKYLRASESLVASTRRAGTALLSIPIYDYEAEARDSAEIPSSNEPRSSVQSRDDSVAPSSMPPTPGSLAGPLSGVDSPNARLMRHKLSKASRADPHLGLMGVLQYKKDIPSYEAVLYLFGPFEVEEAVARALSSAHLKGAREKRRRMYERARAQRREEWVHRTLQQAEAAASALQGLGLASQLAPALINVNSVQSVKAKSGKGNGNSSTSNTAAAGAGGVVVPPRLLGWCHAPLLPVLSPAHRDFVLDSEKLSLSVDLKRADVALEFVRGCSQIYARSRTLLSRARSRAAPSPVAGALAATQPAPLLGKLGPTGSNSSTLGASSVLVSPRSRSTPASALVMASESGRFLAAPILADALPLLDGVSIDVIGTSAVPPSSSIVRGSDITADIAAAGSSSTLPHVLRLPHGTAAISVAADEAWSALDVKEATSSSRVRLEISAMRLPPITFFTANSSLNSASGNPSSSTAAAAMPSTVSEAVYAPGIVDRALSCFIVNFARALRSDLLCFFEARALHIISCCRLSGISVKDYFDTLGGVASDGPQWLLSAVNSSPGPGGDVSTTSSPASSPFRFPPNRFVSSVYSSSILGLDSADSLKSIQTQSMDGKEDSLSSDSSGSLKNTAVPSSSSNINGNSVKFPPFWKMDLNNASDSKIFASIDDDLKSVISPDTLLDIHFPSSIVLNTVLRVLKGESYVPLVLFDSQDGVVVGSAADSSSDLKSAPAKGKEKDKKAANNSTSKSVSTSSDPSSLHFENFNSAFSSSTDFTAIPDIIKSVIGTVSQAGCDSALGRTLAGLLEIVEVATNVLIVSRGLDEARVIAEARVRNAAISLELSNLDDHGQFSRNSSIISMKPLSSDLGLLLLDEYTTFFSRMRALFLRSVLECLQVYTLIDSAATVLVEDVARMSLALGAEIEKAVLNATK